MTELARLATIPKGRNGDELRVSLDEYQPEGTDRTYQFVSLRLWQKADDGSHKPTQKGVTISPNDLKTVALALKEAWVRLEGNRVHDGNAEQEQGIGNGAPGKPREPHPVADSVDCGGYF